MMYSFLNNLCESHLIPSKTSLKNWNVTKISELAYLYFLGLRMLLHDTHSRGWAQSYCKKAGENNDFSTWRSSANDLYAFLYALTGDPDDTDEKISLPHRINISPSMVRNWLRNPTNKETTQQFFTRLDGMFNIDNASMKSIRRILASIDTATSGEKKDCLDKLIQYIHTRAPSNSEIMSHLKDLKSGDDDTKIVEKKQNPFSFIAALESASTGSTSAASVATVVGGLGAGFSDDYSKSIYGDQKPIILRRNPPVKKPKKVTEKAFDDNIKFKLWFGNSKVVDEHGNPLVVYHGTNADFHKFDPNKSGEKSNTGAPPGTFFFTNRTETAHSYTISWQGDFSHTYHDNASIYPVYLSLQKPFVMNAAGRLWDELIYKKEIVDINELADIIKSTNRYDGMIIKKVRDHGRGSVSNKISNTYIAFSPNQIKSAIGNSGSYSADDENITENV